MQVVTNAVWQKQELESPRVPIVRTLLAADNLEITEEAFAVADLGQAVKASNPGGLTRNDLLLVQVRNTGSETRTLQPRLIVDTTLPSISNRRTSACR